jgi:iron complex transport system ATP-binding protein
MDRSKERLLFFESLLIGYVSGRNKNILLPPLNASALKGELIAVLGPNGIGKSTLLKTITGLHYSLGGTVFINDNSINSYSRSDLSQRIGYISTEPVKVSNMTVFDLVSLGRYPYTNWLGKITAEDQEIINDSIEKVGLMKLHERYINELSDGERQKAMIARVLAQDTDIMVMDEPTAFLDIRSKFEIVHLLHDLSGNRGKTIIFSTHDLQTAINESDKIWLTLKDSFVEGAPEDLIIDGSFNTLFDDSRVKFNPSDGSFVFRTELKGHVFVDGRGMERYWTEKAVNRAGYAISKDNYDLTIKVLSEHDNIIWAVEKNKNKLEFISIYELVMWLNQQNR